MFVRRQAGRKEGTKGSGGKDSTVENSFFIGRSVTAIDAFTAQVDDGFCIFQESRPWSGVKTVPKHLIYAGLRFFGVAAKDDYGVIPFGKVFRQVFPNEPVAACYNYLLFHCCDFETKIMVYFITFNNY